MSMGSYLSDLHTHTDFSHGKGSPEDIVRAGIRCGLKRIAITEHAGGHVFFGVRGEKLTRLRKETERLASVYARDIEVLFGLECNLTGFGECDAPKDRGMFDVLLLAYHKGVVPRDGFLLKRSMEAAGMHKSEPELTAKALLAAAEKYRIDIFAHPGEYVKCDIETLARGAKELGTMIEINSRHITLSPDDIRLIAKIGAVMRPDSDAHSPERVGELGPAIAAAAAAGVELPGDGL